MNHKGGTVMRTTVFAAVLAVTLAVAGVTSAHVTLQPSEVPAGTFTRLDVRVPNERDNAGTTKVEVQFPPGFAFVSTEPVPGWTGTIKTRKAAKPIDIEGEKVTEEVDTITWTGDGRSGIVKPGQFQDFGVSIATPDTPGTKLTFKAIQTYDNGEVVRWIGPPDAGEPAPQVALTAAAAAIQPAAGAAGSEDGDGAPVWLVIVAIALGALGLLAGIGGLVRRR
jgi:uncharacterized protein YcnI